MPPFRLKTVARKPIVGGGPPLLRQNHPYICLHKELDPPMNEIPSPPSPLPAPIEPTNGVA